MVLPEGVLNTSNLQKVREYFEGKAKILLICSIPQDVFIAAGATVKPSLVFMKKFTEEEEEEYINAVEKARSEVREKYKDKYFELNKQLDECKDKSTVEKRKIVKLLAELDNIVIDEAKPLIKKYFDYEIPIAKVNDAGITSTGMKTENLELIALEKEFKEYASENKLWKSKKNIIEYDILENDFIQRAINDEKEIMI